MADIVVGVDGSANAAAALRWAFEEAGLRGDHVVALFAWGFVPPGHAGDGHTFDVDYGAAQAQFALQAAVVGAVGPEAARAVEARSVCGPAVEELRIAAKGADLLVVGTRGIGGVHGVLIGSVCHQLLHQAPVPLAVVPAPARPSTGAGTPTRIVAGVDGSPGGRRALAWAADEARRRDVPLDVVRAWHASYPALGPAEGYLVECDAAEEVARHGVEQAVAGLDRSRVTARAVEGRAGPALLATAADAGADLIVLGTRGHGTVAAALVGSVTRYVAHHATVPLVVVP